MNSTDGKDMKTTKTERFGKKKGNTKRENHVKGKEKYKFYKGNKSEGQGFADKRKEKIVHEYKKILRKERMHNKVPNIQHTSSDVECGEPSVDSTSRRPPSTKPKISSFQKAQLAYENKETEKQQIRKDKLHQKEERDKALEKYQHRKRETHRKICKKNFRGQPNMASQIGLLLQKIESSKQ